jgi:hypothetical protein
MILQPVIGMTQHYEFSRGLYRIGYETTTLIYVVSDIYTHDPLGKYDIITDGEDPDIVAAAPGWIRWIVEDFDTTCWSQDQNGNLTCCWMENNYVVMEHPNGEWSQYTHIATGSATAAGISVGDWVSAGTPIGTEGNVGCSTEDHLHLEISRPFDPAFPFDTIGGFMNNLGEMLIPVTCGIGTSKSWMEDSDELLALPCIDNCASTILVTTGVAGGDLSVQRANDAIEMPSGLGIVLAGGSTVQYRAGNEVTLQPGFHAVAGTKFQVILRGCNEQN